MSDLFLIGGFFALILTVVVGGGAWFLKQRERHTNTDEVLLEADPANPTQAALMGALRSLGEAVNSKAKPRDTLRERLLRAGYHSPAAPAQFRGVQVTVGLVLALVLGVLGVFIQEEISAGLVVAFAAFGLGYLFPDRYLKRRIKTRGLALRRGLPNAMDLLVLSLEAGQTIDYACLELSRQLRFSFPELASEFGMIHAELRAGNSRADALRNFAARTGEAEIRKLTNLLVDGDRFGTQLAHTLRTHARYSRTRLRQQAQEAARKIGVKMVFPLVLLIFPALLLVTLGPALLQMQQVLGNMFNGM